MDIFLRSHASWPATSGLRDIQIIGGEWPRRMDGHRRRRGEEDQPAAEDGPWGRPCEDRNGYRDIDVDAGPVSPVERVDEIVPGWRLCTGLGAPSVSPGGATDPASATEALKR